MFDAHTRGGQNGPMGDPQFAAFLELFDAQKIADKLQEDGTVWDSSTGTKAQLAISVLNAGQVERAVKALEKTSTRLGEASDRLARWGVGVAWCALVVSIVALVVTAVKG